VFIVQPIVDRLSGDVVVHRVLHDDQRRRLSQAADIRDLFSPDIQDLREKFIARGRIRLGTDLVPNLPDLPKEVAGRRRFAFVSFSPTFQRPYATA
jgi:hypothetical protein